MYEYILFSKKNQSIIYTDTISDQRSFTHKTTNIRKWLLLNDPVFFTWI